VVAISARADIVADGTSSAHLPDEEAIVLVTAKLTALTSMLRRGETVLDLGDAPGVLD
jgi:hypothetical protein